MQYPRRPALPQRNDRIDRKGALQNAPFLFDRQSGEACGGDGIGQACGRPLIRPFRGTYLRPKSRRCAAVGLRNASAEAIPHRGKALGRLRRPAFTCEVFYACKNLYTSGCCIVFSRTQKKQHRLPPVGEGGAQRRMRGRWRACPIQSPPQAISVPTRNRVRFATRPVHRVKDALPLNRSASTWPRRWQAPPSAPSAHSAGRRSPKCKYP